MKTCWMKRSAGVIALAWFRVSKIADGLQWTFSFGGLSQIGDNYLLLIILHVDQTLPFQKLEHKTLYSFVKKGL